MNTKAKFIFGFLLYTIYFILNTSVVSAALVTVNQDGQVIWQVLGTETNNLKIPPKPEIKIKSLSQEISLNNENEKIILNGMDVTSLKENLVEIEARANTNDLKISGNNGQFGIEENGITANTSFPITIDPAKNELSVETSSGNRLISVLPYEAVVTLMRNNLLDNVKENNITLAESSKGELQYEIKGIKNVNLFNVMTLNANVNSIVSASNGEITKIDEPQWLKFFGFIFKS